MNVLVDEFILNEEGVRLNDTLFVVKETPLLKEDEAPLNVLLVVVRNAVWLSRLRTAAEEEVTKSDNTEARPTTSINTCLTAIFLSNKGVNILSV